MNLYLRHMQPTNQRFAFSVLTSLFFLWGFITVMNDVLIGTFKELFTLSNFQSGLVQFSFFGAFFVISSLYFWISKTFGDPINRVGYKNGMVTGLALCGLGCCLFYPAALAGSYGFFLSALFVLASGVCVLQIAANPYAAILGPTETASSRLNLAQGFNSLGTTLGPLVGAVLIFMVFSTGALSAEAVGKTYLMYGLVFLGMAMLIKLLPLPGFRNTEQQPEGWGALRFKQLRRGMAAIFLYVGAEVAIGSWLVSFAVLPNIMGISQAEANTFLSWYWGGLMLGRLLGAISLSSIRPEMRKKLAMAGMSIAVFGLIYLVTSISEQDGSFGFKLHNAETVVLFMLLVALNFLGFLMGRSAAGRTLGVFAMVNVALLSTAVLTSGTLAFWALIGTGLFNSIMWSNIFTLAIRKLGVYTSQGSSLLILAIVGGAFLPPAQGLLADYFGIQGSFLLLVPAYLYLAWYGYRGHLNNQGT